MQNSAGKSCSNKIIPGLVFFCNFVIVLLPTHQHHRFMSQLQKKIYGRVNEAMLCFSRIIFEQDSFELPFTRQEFADLIVVSRESATRVLLKFQGEGLLQIRGRSIIITNQAMLEQISRIG
jgi:CRP-like cAMP-binding protein